MVRRPFQKTLWQSVAKQTCRTGSNSLSSARQRKHPRGLRLSLVFSRRYARYLEGETNSTNREESKWNSVGSQSQIGNELRRSEPLALSWAVD